MMHEREKSDPAVVAVKPVNNVERSAAESVEPRAGAKGNASWHSTDRAQKRATVSQGLERIRQVARQRNPWPRIRFAVTHPRWEPYAGKPHVRFCAGGAQQ